LGSLGNALKKRAVVFSHSYTNWSETITNVSSRAVSAADHSAVITVQVKVENLGRMRGDRAVLLSLRRQASGASAALSEVAAGSASEETPGASEEGWPLRWLVDFAKVHGIEPGEIRHVELKLTAEEGWLQWCGKRLFVRTG
jgi:hypothetical protein